MTNIFLYFIFFMFLYSIPCLCFYFVNLIEKKEEEKWKSLDTEKITKI